MPRTDHVRPVASRPIDQVTFAGLTVDLGSRLLLIPGRREAVPIALGVDQARTLRLLMGGRGDAVPVEQIERDSVNTAETTVLSLNALLYGIDALATIVKDNHTAYRMIDLAAAVTLAFGDLRLNQVTRLLLVGERTSIMLSPASAAVLGLLIQAQGAPVGPGPLRSVVTRTTPGAAVANLGRRLKPTGTTVMIANDRARGWRLVHW